MAALIAPGDEVLIEHPTYEPMLGAASFLGAKIKRFERKPADAFRLDPAAVERPCSRRTHAPDRHHQPPQSRAALWPTKPSFARSASSPQASARTCWSTRSISTAAVPPRPSAVHLGPSSSCTNSLTKVYGLSGLRCGWILAEPELAERMWRLNDLFGVNQAHQAERLACIAFEHIDEVIGDNPAMLERNRDALQRLRRRRATTSTARRPSMASPPSRAGPAATPSGSMTICASATTRRSSPAAGSRCPTISASASALPTDDSTKRSTGSAPALDDLKMKREQVFEFFRRLAEANPSPTTELEYRNPYTLLVAVVLSAQATDASVNIATRPLFARIKTPRADARSRRGTRCATRSRRIGLFNTKAKNVIALSQALIDQSRRRGPAHARRAAGAARRRPQDRQCGAQHRLRRGDVRGRHPRLPRLQPHRPRARQDGRRGRSQAREDRPAALPPRRAPLADPARPLHLQGAAARMLALPGDRPLPLQAEDAAARGAR